MRRNQILKIFGNICFVNPSPIKLLLKPLLIWELQITTKIYLLSKILFSFSVEKIYTSRRNRSLQEIKIQSEKQSSWFEEDKIKFLDTNVNIRDIQKFISADFEMIEYSNERKINQSQLLLTKYFRGRKSRKLLMKKIK